jgi:hypothetical protein
MHSIYTRFRCIWWISLQENPPQEKEVNDMKKSLIPFAGIFLACVICAGIPAVAAENQNPSLSPGTTIKPVETQQPWYTPITDLIGMHQQTASAGQPVNTTASQLQTPQNWWENLLPWHETKDTTQQGSTGQNQNLNQNPGTVQNPAPVNTPAPTTQAIPSITPNTDKPQNSPVPRTP